jgi:hypothetical protein
LSAYGRAGDAGGAAAAYRAMLAAGARPDARTMLALLRAAFHAQQGPAAVAAVRREMHAWRLPLNLQLATAMLCCLRHVRPAPYAMHALAEGQPVPAAAGKQAAAAPAADKAGTAAAAEAAGRGQAGGGSADLRAACLAEARALFGRMAAHARRAGQPLDLRAYNSLLLVQLAAEDWGGVLATFRRLEEDEAAPLPDATTLGVVIAACRAAGWGELEEQYCRLQEGSRLLGALGGDGGGSGGSHRRARGGHGSDAGSGSDEDA